MHEGCSAGSAGEEGGGRRKEGGGRRKEGGGRRKEGRGEEGGVKVGGGEETRRCEASTGQRNHQTMRPLAQKSRAGD
jgi:hypothetical protein